MYTLEPSPRIEQIDALLNDGDRTMPFVGVISVSKDGEVIHQAAYGPASRELNVLHNENSIFLTGSITKLVTLLTVMKVVEAGDLSFDDLIVDIFPDARLKDAHDITVLHLLTHKAGLPGFRSGAIELKSFEIQAGDAYESTDYINYVFELPREGAPGERFVYGNLSYDVLVLAIEQVTELPFSDNVEQLVLAPLGMQHSGMNAREMLVKNRVPGYDLIDGEIFNAQQSAGGSLYSTAEDLSYLISGIFERAFFSEDQVEFVKSNGLFKSTIETSDGDSIEVLWFNGIDMGYSAEVAYFPKSNTAVGVASNVNAVNFRDLREAIAEHITSD